MNSAGGRKTSSGTIFPWQLAEDNPVISWWGNNLRNKVGGRVRVLRVTSFQNLLGISLLFGEMDWIFLGKLLDWTLLGKFCIGRGSTECLVYRRGTILDQDCRGCLLRMLAYSAEECLDLLGTPNFLKTDSITLLGESVLTCWLTLWGVKMYWLCSSAELTLVPWWIE